MPDSATMVNCPDGFFDSMTEEQAKKFYDIIKPLIPTEWAFFELPVNSLLRLSDYDGARDFSFS